MSTLLRHSACLSIAIALALAWDRDAAAQQPSGGDAIHYRVVADTYARLFQRATTPGIVGVAPSAESAAPVVDYVLIEVADIDAPWRADGIDVELAAWGDVDLAGTGEDVRRVDGDIGVASVRQRFDAGSLTLGRQVRGGGAARFVRFDGVSASVAAPWGVSADAYGGLTVLPRWSERPGYVLLGSAADDLLRAPQAVPEPERREHWLAGGALRWHRGTLVDLGTSIHEERQDGGLARRNAAADMVLTPAKWLALRGAGLLDLDAIELSDARASIDARLIDALDVSASVAHAVPALLLSKQSVLSVFSSEAFDEVGLQVELRARSDLRFGGESFVEALADGRAGYRAGGSVRVSPHVGGRPALVLGYRRVREPDAGYHALRAAIALSPAEPVTITTEAWAYLYDAPIDGVPTSSVGSITARWAPMRRFAASLGGSVTRSPRAAFDAQALARFEFVIEGGGR